jgi:hypothetical protein
MEHDVDCRLRWKPITSWKQAVCQAGLPLGRWTLYSISTALSFYVET